MTHNWFQTQYDLITGKEAERVAHQLYDELETLARRADDELTITQIRKLRIRFERRKRKRI